MESDDVRHTFEYDAAGRPVHETAEASDGPVHRRPITYDAAGRTARYGSPGHTSLYRYDEHGRVVRRDGESSPDFTSYEAWEYDAPGAVVRW
jgi:YD repeat-containing protein